MSDTKMPDKPTEANLIAAAQDLYDALDGAVLSVEWRASVMHSPNGINPDPEAHAALWQFVRKCRAALAKARGVTLSGGIAATLERRPNADSPNV